MSDYEKPPCKKCNSTEYKVTYPTLGLYDASCYGFKGQVCLECWSKMRTEHQAKFEPGFSPAKDEWVFIKRTRHSQSIKESVYRLSKRMSELPKDILIDMGDGTSFERAVESYKWRRHPGNFGGDVEIAKGLKSDHLYAKITVFID